MSDNEHTEIEVHQPAVKRHRRFSVEFKLRVIKAAKKPGSVHAASDSFGVDRKTVREWLRDEKDLVQQA
jgi:transposase-like protein